MSANGSASHSIEEALSSEKAQLEDYFAGRNKTSEVWITDYKRGPSGFSNETRFFTLNTRSDGKTVSREVVARWAPKGPGHFLEYDLSFQYKAMQALAKTPIPVPEVILFESDPSFTGTPFYVMAKVQGETTSDYPPGMHGAGFLFEAAADDQRRVWEQSIDIMVELHLLDWRNLPDFSFVPVPDNPVESVRIRNDRNRKMLAAASDATIPSIERALDWADKHIPTPDRMTLCWSDPRPGNILFRNYRPVAALDWEGLHIAPPETDLAWFLLCDEVAYKAHRQKRLAGFPDETQTIAYYESRVGRKVQDFHYYMIMQSALLSILMVSTVRVAKEKGIEGFPEDFATNNVAIHRLDDLMAQTS